MRLRNEIGTDEDPQHFHDEMGEHVGSRLNWLRAGVLGANDGIVSTAGIVMGVAGATDDSGTILIAGIAGLVAGALSMGTGEYVSVCTQRDSEQALLGRRNTGETTQSRRRRSWPSSPTCTSRRAVGPKTREQRSRGAHRARRPGRAHAEIEAGSTPTTSPTLGTPRGRR